MATGRRGRRSRVASAKKGQDPAPGTYPGAESCLTMPTGGGSWVVRQTTSMWRAELAAAANRAVVCVTTR
jgi:hypothetical protein